MQYESLTPWGEQGRAVNMRFSDARTAVHLVNSICATSRASSVSANGRAGSVSVAAIGGRGYSRPVPRMEMMTAVVFGFLLSL